MNRTKRIDECKIAIIVESAYQLANCVRNDLYDYIQSRKNTETEEMDFSDLDIVYEVCGTDCLNFYIYDPEYIELDGWHDDWHFKKQEEIVVDTQLIIVQHPQLEIYHLHDEDMLWFWRNYDKEMDKMKRRIDEYAKTKTKS